MSRGGSDSSPDLGGKSMRPLRQPEQKQEVTSGCPQRGWCGGHRGGQGAPTPQTTQPVALCHQLRPPELLPDFLAGCSPHRTEGAQSVGCFQGQSGSLRHPVVPGQVALGLLQLVGNSELGRRNWEMAQRHLAAAKGVGCRMWKVLGVSLCFKFPAPPASPGSAERSVCFHFPAWPSRQASAGNFPQKRKQNQKRRRRKQCSDLELRKASIISDPKPKDRGGDREWKQPPG